MANEKEETTGTDKWPRPTVAAEVQVAMILDGDRDLWSIIENLGLLRFLNGDEPYLREFEAYGVSGPEAILPDDCATTRHINTPASAGVLAVGSEWTATVTVVNGTNHAYVRVTAASDEVAQLICKQIAAKVPKPPASSDRVTLIFWHHSGSCARQAPREIEAPEWPDIRRNYPSTTGAALDRLVNLSPPGTGGRLVLLHGEPGTGKTTLLRALARGWSSWCRTDYIVDADRLFASPSYLLEVITARTPALPEGPLELRPWRLLIIEDCDELIRADAKRETGQALSRLLNVTDGMVGQGLRVLMCITTNEDVHRLHRAVTRPGRCLANIAVGRFEHAEAAAWLGRADGIPAAGATLAELYAISADDAPVEATAATGPAGGYL